MEKRVGQKRKNPFRMSFLLVTTICCVTLCVLFSFISYFDHKDREVNNIRNKAELVVNDFEKQIEMMEQMSYRIASDYDFFSYYFQKDIGRELAMLDKFKQYKYTLLLTEDYFLYYGGKYVYRSTGSTYDYNRFLADQFEVEEERLLFESAMTDIREITSISDMKQIGTKTIVTSDQIFAMIPVKGVIERDGAAVLVFVIDKDTLDQRFQLVSGGLEGNISLYGAAGLLYSNQDVPVSAGQKNVITVDSPELDYSICCLLEISIIWNSHFPQDLLLILTAILLIFLISNFFAQRAYRPIEVMRNRYREQYSTEDTVAENALEEIEYMLDIMHRSNIESKKVIREQILQRLMEGSYTFGTLISLDREELYLPGPYYFVISILYDEYLVGMELLDRIRNEVEQSGGEKDHIYTLCNDKDQIINVICSMYSEESRERIIAAVYGVVERVDGILRTGVGSVYPVLNNLSASWLESTDNLREKEKQEGAGFDFEDIQKIEMLLELGNEEESKRSFERYLEKLKDGGVSFLMQQCIMVEFVSAIKRLSDKYHLRLSDQDLSLMIAGKNVYDFEIAAKRLMRNFCEQYALVRSRREDEKANRICAYIEEHFAEYDSSLEGAASALGVDTASVRVAVMQKMGMGYRDYLIYLRIEYAKTLLRDTKLPVSAVCEKVGYGNVSHFIKTFKEMTGVTPAKFRQMDNA